MAQTRTTDFGLNPGIEIYITGAPRRHARGTFMRLSDIADIVYYRSAHNGGEYQAPLEKVHIDRKIARRRRAMSEVE